ncbi:MAG: NAD(P)-binding domain-containing protein [Planctomycetota bacterium]
MQSLRAATVSEQALSNRDGAASPDRKTCVIGAGSSGLAVTKALLDADIEVDCLERGDDLGGNWFYGAGASSVCQSTHLISSKRLTEYEHFPMPDDYPEFPHHRLVHRYLGDYATRYNLRDHIRFGVGVARAESADLGWRVQLDSGEVRHYRRLIVANGHNWDPRWPEFPGEFGGVALHSSQYKTPEVLRGKRVLVVGGGNSGCDIAVEAAQNAEFTAISLRRGYHMLPKFLHGTPIDVCGERLLRWRVPLSARRLVASAASFLLLGYPPWLGLPKPDHRLFETHPIINSQLVYHVGHGDIAVRPNVAELLPNGVRFTDGRVESFDVIVYATGFKTSFPFFESPAFQWRDGRPALLHNVFHPERDDLFFAGLIQPDSGQFGLVGLQAELIAAYLKAIDEERPVADWFRRVKREQAGRRQTRINYVDSPRHALEVEHFTYRRSLKRLLKRFT